jgi:hypothetical protein
MEEKIKKLEIKNKKLSVRENKKKGLILVCLVVSNQKIVIRNQGKVINQTNLKR